MIRHQVDDHADTAAMRFADQPIEGRDVAVVLMHSAVIADVVAPVLQRRRIDRIQPDRIDAERVRPAIQIIKMRRDSIEVADSIAIRIRPRPRIDLIEDRPLPPLHIHRACSVI